MSKEEKVKELVVNRIMELSKVDGGSFLGKFIKIYKDGEELKDVSEIYRVNGSRVGQWNAIQLVRTDGYITYNKYTYFDDDDVMKTKNIPPTTIIEDVNWEYHFPGE